MIWQTRTLAVWLAYNIQVGDKADAQALVTAASQVGMTADEIARSEALSEDQDTKTQTKKQPESAGAEPKTGSYEAFMAAFAGGGMR